MVSTRPSESITTPVPSRCAPRLREVRALATTLLRTLTTESASTLNSCCAPPAGGADPGTGSAATASVAARQANDKAAQALRPTAIVILAAESAIARARSLQAFIQPTPLIPCAYATPFGALGDRKTSRKPHLALRRTVTSRTTRVFQPDPSDGVDDLQSGLSPSRGDSGAGTERQGRRGDRRHGRPRE